MKFWKFLRAFSYYLQAFSVLWVAFLIYLGAVGRLEWWFAGAYMFVGACWFVTAHFWRLAAKAWLS